jgi:hypothetical protein
MLLFFRAKRAVYRGLRGSTAAGVGARFVADLTDIKRRRASVASIDASIE